MKKLLTMLGLSLVLSGFGIKSYSQSSGEIPAIVRKQAVKYLQYVNYCDTVPKLEKVGEKFEDRTGPMEVKDGIKDKITLYKMNNDCDWSNVPNYLTLTQAGIKKDGFSSGTVEGIISRDEKGKPVPLEDW
jgi:hypothetical protein